MSKFKQLDFKCEEGLDLREILRKYTNKLPVGDFYAVELQRKKLWNQWREGADSIDEYCFKTQVITSIRVQGLG